MCQLSQSQVISNIIAKKGKLVVDLLLLCCIMPRDDGVFCVTSLCNLFIVMQPLISYLTVVSDRLIAFISETLEGYLALYMREKLYGTHSCFIMKAAKHESGKRS